MTENRGALYPKSRADAVRCLTLEWVRIAEGNIDGKFP
jgi:hypothetical protein